VRWLLFALIGCARPPEGKQLDLEAIKISSDARMRTDTVGEGKFASNSTFVLVDAENTAGEGAYVTLAGELTDAAGKVVGELKPQSLWVPAHDARTFALVDVERVPRPTATSAKIIVKGAKVPLDPPRARIEDLHTFDDHGKLVVQANLVNDAERIGQIMVIGSFHDAQHQPITRPFAMYDMNPHDKRFVQFVGPPGAVAATIFVGDAVY
jgi:hypothetical protein